MDSVSGTSEGGVTAERAGRGDVAAWTERTCWLGAPVGVSAPADGYRESAGAYLRERGEAVASGPVQPVCYTLRPKSSGGEQERAKCDGGTSSGGPFRRCPGHGRTRRTLARRRALVLPSHGGVGRAAADSGYGWVVVIRGVVVIRPSAKGVHRGVGDVLGRSCACRSHRRTAFRGGHDRIVRPPAPPVGPQPSPIPSGRKGAGRCPSPHAGPRSDRRRPARSCGPDGPDSVSLTRPCRPRRLCAMKATIRGSYGSGGRAEQTAVVKPQWPEPACSPVVGEMC